jgi:hypothetical protein
MYIMQLVCSNVIKQVSYVPFWWHVVISTSMQQNLVIACILLNVSGNLIHHNVELCNRAITVVVYIYILYDLRCYAPPPQLLAKVVRVAAVVVFVVV